MPVLLLVVMLARLRSYGGRYKTMHRHRCAGLKRWPEIRDAVTTEPAVPGAVHETSAGANNRGVRDGFPTAPAPAGFHTQTVRVKIIGACRDDRCVAGIIRRSIAPGVTAVEDCRTCGALGFRTRITRRHHATAGAS
jgi:hypothetical protein